MTQSRQQSTPSLPAIVGSVSNAQVLNARLEAANKAFHLVAPQTAAGSLPEGCDVVISAVMIDEARDTYPIPGSSDRGLSKIALDKIASAAGISWDSRLSGRLDNGSEPRYCHYRAVGHIRNFDGTARTIIAEKEIDTRDGSPFVQATIEKSARKAKEEAKKKGQTLSESEAMRMGRQAAENQIRELRLHILSHAETKARLRAVRSLGVRTSYKSDELKKPFVVASLAFTGRTNDPALRREFALATQKAMFGANTALYGQDAGAVATIQHAPAPVMQSAPPLHAPPPVGAGGYEEDDGFDGPMIDVEPERTAPPRQQSAPSQAPASAPSGDLSGHFMPAKKGDPRVPIEHAEDDQINYWRNRLKKGLDEGTSNYPDKDRTLLEAMDRELKRRFEGDAPAGEVEVPF